MNINDLIMSGASEDEIAKAVAEAKTEKARKDEVERLKKEKAAKEKEDNARIEALKAEARAYAINAIILYSQVYGVIEEKDLDPEEVAKYEQFLIKLEAMVPVYMKLAQMQDEIDKNFGFGFGLGGLM